MIRYGDFMKIGVNCLSIDPSYKGGVNTYTFGLLDGFARVAEGHQFQIYASGENIGLFERYREHPGFSVFEIPFAGMRGIANRVFKPLSAYSGLKGFHRTVVDLFFGDVVRLMDQHSDLIYTPTTVLFPYTFSKPTILSMHDIQQVHFPQFFSRAELIKRKVRFAISAEQATYLQASSEFIKQDLLEHFEGLKPEQVVVIPEGVTEDEFASRKEGGDVRAKYGIPADFLFYPAQLWPHKNHITALKALERLRRDHGMTISLVLTGAEFAASGEIFDFIRAHGMDYVHYLGKVPFEDLVALYQSARFFITAVLYESSSLPLLEAAAAGCPLIASDTPPNREMSRILNIELFEPLDDCGLADLLSRIWNDDRLIEQQILHNSKHIGYYSWDNAAKRYLELMTSITLTK